MKHVSVVVLLLTSCVFAVGQTIWAGDPITFSKAAYADWTLAEHQDRITDSVWLSRASTQSLINVRTDSVYEPFVSPRGTEWSFGTTADLDSLTFVSFQDMVAQQPNGPKGLIGQPLVLHILHADIYLDLTFLSWGGGNTGGEFSYERTTDGATAISSGLSPEFRLFPNPVQSWLQADQPLTGELSITDLTGREVLRTYAINASNWHLGHLPPGMYHFRLISDTRITHTFSFVKS